MNRNIFDNDLSETIATPAANTSAATEAIDLGANPWPTSERFQFAIEAEAYPNLVEDEEITFTVQGSADGESWAPLGGASVTVTGGSGNGAAATSARKAVPLDVPRYVRLSVAVAADAGNNTASSVTFAIAF